MFIYFLNIILLMVFAIYFYNKNNIQNNNLLFCTIIFFQLFFISAFRYNIGVDYNSYSKHFFEISKLKFGEVFQYQFEYGFSILNKIVAYFTGNFQILVIICSFITIGFVSFSIYKNSTHKFYSFFLYITLSFYYSSFNLIRQGIAIAISLLGLKYLIERKFLKYLFIILIASSFHYSVLIMIPIYFIANINLTYKTFIFFISFSFLVYIFLDDIVKIGMKIFPTYESYLYTDFLQGKTFNSIILPLFIFLILIIFRKYILYQNKKNMIYLNISYFCLLISLFQTKIGILDRFPSYLNAISIFSIPILIDCFKDRAQKNLVAGLIIIFGILYNIYSFISGFYGVVPYESIF